MAITRTILAGLSTALLIPTAALAQMCRGAPPLAGNSFANVSAGISLFDTGNTISGGATVGSRMFVSAAGSHTRYDVGGRSQNAAGGTVGYEITSLGPAISLCPTMSVSYGWGLEDLGVDFTTVSFLPAVAASYRIVLEPTVDVVPAVELAVAHDRITADGPGGTVTVRDWYGMILMSLGFQIRQRWVIVPVVQFPIADEGVSSVFGIGLGVALGGGS